MTNYTSIKLPQVLAEQIREISEKKGYTSVSDFVVFATRSKLKEELQS